MMVTLQLSEVYDLAFEALTGAGADPENAASVALSMREAEADGIRNVGLAYLPIYCEHLICGKVDGKARPALTRTRPGALAVDARRGFAHPAYMLGEARLLELARSHGLAGLAVTNSYANGVVGFFVERIARAGLIGLAVTNASPSIAPWGGKTPLFGTNPLAFGIPRQAAPPVIIDQSSSTTARVSVATAAAQGDTIPDTWALDRAGRPTTDPEEGLKGSMAPLGGYKGSALALMVEVLAAGLGGAQWSFEASSLGDNEGGPPRLGQLYLAIDPAGFGGGDFGARIEELLAAMLTQEGVRLPGDSRHAARRRADRDGVQLDADLHARLLAFAAGVE